MNTLKAVFTRLKKEESKKINLSLVDDINNILGELDFGYDNIYASTDKLNPARPSITEPLFGILDGINSEIKNLETAVNEVSTRIGIYRNYSEQFIGAASMRPSMPNSRSSFPRSRIRTSVSPSSERVLKEFRGERR